MSDPKHSQDQQQFPPAGKPGGRRVFVEEDHLEQEPERLDELLKRASKTRGGRRGKDEPTPASALEDAAQIQLARERNTVRRETEDLKDRRVRRWCFVLVLVILAVVALASAAFSVVVTLHEQYALAASAVAVLGGSGAFSWRVWNKFSEALIPPDPTARGAHLTEEPRPSGSPSETDP
jgi:hypothetical protein